MGYYSRRSYSSGRKTSLGEAILYLGALIGVLAVMYSCSTPVIDDGEPYETLSTDTNIDDENLENYFEPTVAYDADSLEVTFAPGEHIVAVTIDDPIGEPTVYKGHPGYKPIGIAASAYGIYLPTYHAGYMLFENTVEVKTTATDTDSKGNYIYNNFGTPVDYEIKSYGDNSYDTYQHIIAMPFTADGPRTQIEPVDGYEIVGIATASYGRYGGSSAGSCILYVNTEPVENCVDEYSIPKFGTPIEKQKVLEKQL